MSTVLRTEELSIQFGGLVAVDKVSVEVESGAICGLIGPNGSGKSTLVNLITGFYSANSGKVYIDGEDVTHDKTHTHVKKGIARTFQHTRNFDTLTVEESVMGGCVYQSSANIISQVLFSPRSIANYKAHRQKAQETLDFIQMSHLRKKNAAEIPHGYQRFLEIARALATDPKVLLLDEPAAGMTAREIQFLIELLAKLQAKGISVIVIEHNNGFVKEVSNKIVVLNFGKKIADGLPDEVMRLPEVVRAYLGGGARA